MWIDQRERGSKAGWVWGSILFHAGIAGFFIMSNSPEHSLLSSANATENVTMTVIEAKPAAATEVKATEVKEAAPAKVEKVEKTEETVKVAPAPVPAPVKKVEKPKTKKTAVVTALPKKEVQPEQLDSKIEDQAKDDSVKGVVVPVTEEAQEVKTTDLKDLKEQSLDEEVANLKDEEQLAKEEQAPAVAALPTKQAVQAQQEVGQGQDAATMAPAAAAQSANSSGTSSNPRSYLDLKQKAGNVPPKYPDAARKQGLQGQVQLKYFVNEDGTVSNVQVMKSSGSALLDKEAANSISQYQFYPGQEGWASHPVSFSLKGPEQKTVGRLRTTRGG